MNDNVKYNTRENILNDHNGTKTFLHGTGRKAATWKLTKIRRKVPGPYHIIGGLRKSTQAEFLDRMISLGFFASRIVSYSKAYSA